jgi:translation elongation factor EF-Ts
VQSKPENVREKIVEGMLNKRFYAESVLSEQQWYRPDEATGTVAQVLKERGIELLDYAWYSVS